MPDATKRTKNIWDRTKKAFNGDVLFIKKARIDKELIKRFLYPSFVFVPFCFAFLITHPAMTDSLWWFLKPILNNTLIVGSIGLIFNFVVIFHSMIGFALRCQKPSREEVNKLVFNISKFAIMAIGYLQYIPFGMTPFVGLTFVIATGMDVVYSLYDFFHFYRDKDKNTVKTDLLMRGRLALETVYNCQLQIVALNILEALTITAIMAMWSFMPGSIIVVGAPAILGMGVVMAMRWGAAYCLYKRRDEKLEELQNTRPESVELAKGSSDSSFSRVSHDGFTIPLRRTSTGREASSRRSYGWGLTNGLGRSREPFSKRSPFKKSKKHLYHRDTNPVISTNLVDNGLTL